MIGRNRKLSWTRRLADHELVHRFDAGSLPAGLA
jgi:hypothetical protein